MEIIIIIVVALQLDLLLGRHIEVLRIIHITLRVDRHVGREVHVDLAFLAGALGGDDDDTVGGAGAVDGGCGRVFQHVDALDVVGVEVIDASFHRQAVHHEERVGLGVHRADAADGHLAAIGRETCHAAFEVLHQARAVALLDLLGVDRGDGARNFLLLDFLITCDDRTFDEHAAVGHLHVELCASVQRLGDGVHAEETHLDGGIPRVLHCQRIVTIDVGDGVGLLVQVLDGSTCYRKAILVGDATADHAGSGGLALLLGRRSGR